MAKRCMPQHQRGRAAFAAQGEVIERKDGGIGAFGHAGLGRGMQIVVNVYHASLAEAQADTRVLGVQGASVRYECRLREVINLSDKPLGGCLILLDVLGVDVDESVLHEGAIAPSKLQALGKLGADLYCTTATHIERSRPPAPKSSK